MAATATDTPSAAAPSDAMPGRPIVDITALRKSYGTNEVLKGIDLKVQRGEVIAIIGKSGSGKSTLLRCVNGLEVFQEGALSVNGQKLMHESPTAMRALRQQVGMIFQNFNLFPHLSVGRNIMLAPTLVKARDAKAAAEQARQLLARVGLAEKFDAMPDQLSGGQQQRVAVARALVTRPALLLADEPTGNLDSKAAVEVFQLFRKFNHEFGCAVLLVTHDARMSEQCDRTIRLADGSIESDDGAGS